MRFLVPQFIEIEDKIFGPLSFRQFAYVIGAVGFCVILYTYFGFILAVLIGSPFLILGLLLAFYRVNNRSFVYLLQSALYYGINKKLYLWKQTPKQKKVFTAEPNTTIIKPFVPKVSENKLKDLAWSLDIKESMYSGGKTQSKEAE